MRFILYISLTVNCVLLVLSGYVLLSEASHPNASDTMTVNVDGPNSLEVSHGSTNKPISKEDLEKLDKRPDAHTSSDVSAQLTNLDKQKANLKSYLINGIDTGKIGVNESLIEGVADATPLLVYLSESQSIADEDIQLFFERGATVFDSHLWQLVIADNGSATSFSRLQESGFIPTKNFLGLSFIEHAYLNNNYSLVRHLQQQGVVMRDTVVFKGTNMTLDEVRAIYRESITMDNLLNVQRVKQHE